MRVDPAHLQVLKFLAIMAIPALVVVAAIPDGAFGVVFVYVGNAVALLLTAKSDKNPITGASSIRPELPDDDRGQVDGPGWLIMVMVMALATAGTVIITSI